MHPISIFAGAVILAGATSFATVKLMGPAGHDEAPRGIDEDALRELREGQASLERTLRDLGTRLDGLDTREMRAAIPAPAEPTSASTSDAAVPAAKDSGEPSAQQHASTV